MASGYYCTCAEKTKPPKDRNWVIIQRNCNHSAFNGYHETASDYSEVQCRICLCSWRTKGAYTDVLPGGELTNKRQAPKDPQ